ncbi:MAG: carbohydrate ABC transporter permease [Hungatella sp.]|nr:carbohydrate ABC transporter permease [Hungatella sp.]
MKHRHSGNTSDKIFMIVNHLLAFLFLVICLYPMYFILIASVSNVGMVTGGEVFLLPKGLTTAGYRMLMEKKEIWVGYKNTILYTLFGTMFNLALTIPAGYALSIRTLPFRRGLNFLFLVTMFISGGMIPTYLLVNHLRLVNTFAVMVIIGGVNVWNLTLCRNFFSTNIPAELRDAARIDGSSEFGIFFKIVLPISKAIVAVMVLYFAVSHWNGYHNALIYLREEAKYPLQLVLRNLLLQNTLSSETDAAGMSRLMDLQSMKYGVIVVASLPVMILYPFVQRYFVKGVMVGSVKG